MNPFTYDFGYDWIWNWGHLLAIVPFGVLTAVALKLGWKRWITVVSAALTIWGVVGLVIVQMVVRMNLPLELPSQQFLQAGTGRVLDAGAGSGRASLMVLLDRPQSRVLAMDIYDGYFGISDNTPERLFANAEIAGVRDRVDARIGDVTQMALEDASLEAVVSSYVIDHLSQEGVESSLTEIERVLRPGGDFLLMVIDADVWVRVAYPFLASHGYFGSTTPAAYWTSQLQEAGFEIVETGTTPGTLYLLGRKGGAERDQAAVNSIRP